MATNSALVIVLVLAYSCWRAPKGRSLSEHCADYAPIRSLPSSDFLLSSVYQIVAGLYFRIEGGADVQVAIAAVHACSRTDFNYFVA
jgi:hypothetical protein